ERISKPGPNLVLAFLLSRVAGESNRALGGGFGGSDWPGAEAPPEAAGATAVAGVPTSGDAVPAGPSPDEPGRGAREPGATGPDTPAAGCALPTWALSCWTIASSWRMRASSASVFVSGTRGAPASGAGGAGKGSCGGVGGGDVGRGGA